MAKVIAISQQKGGTGKTTTTAHLARALVEMNKRVLLVDTDPQGSLSVSFGLNPDEEDCTIYEMLESRDGTLDVRKNLRPHLDIIPANIHLAKANFTLIGRYHREEILRSKLKPYQSEYDFILIDCPPDLNVLTLNALTAADGVIIPVQTQYLSLRGMRDLLDTIAEVREHGNPTLRIMGVLPTMYDGTIHAKEALAALTELGKQSGYTLMEPIKRRKAFPELSQQGITLFDRSRRDDSDLLSAYKFLAQEVVSHA